MIALSPIQNNQVIRGCNSSGCGAFGAGRGNRDHNGVDINVNPGSSIKAPFSGTLLRKGFRIYIDSRPALEGIEIVHESGYEMKIFYVTTSLPIGHRFNAGDVIAIAQNMKQYYSNPEMPNHAHLEIRDPQGNIVDFTNWFKSPAGSAIGILLLLGGFAALAYGLSRIEQKSA